MAIGNLHTVGSRHFDGQPAATQNNNCPLPFESETQARRAASQGWELTPGSFVVFTSGRDPVSSDYNGYDAGGLAAGFVAFPA